MNDQETLTALKALFSTQRPFDCDPRGDVYRVLIYADERSYVGEGVEFSEAASNAVKCFRLKGDK